jgi:hypothetical protein
MLLPWKNRLYTVKVITNEGRSKDAMAAPRAYAVVNNETGIEEAMTLQLANAFKFAVESERAIDALVAQAMLGAADRGNRTH